MCIGPLSKISCFVATDPRDLRVLASLATFCYAFAFVYQDDQWAYVEQQGSGCNPMKQAIAGVSPPGAQEVTVMRVFPSIARYFSGQMLGKLYSIDVGVSVLTVGNLLALASIPHALALYFYRLLPSVLGFPWHGSSYLLTNRRVMELRTEVNFGEGPRWLRIAGGVKLILLGVVAFCLVQQFLIGWAWPASAIQWALTVVCCLLVLGGIVPLLAEALGEPVPMPCIRFDAEVKSIELDRFDVIEIDCKPGQEWFAAGDLVFKRGDVETFRLEGVSRPESFRQTCLKSHQSYVGVKQALDRAAVPA